MKKNRIDKSPLKLLDVVALLKDIPEEKLVKGQVGTVVEELDEAVYEIEFANKQGETLVNLALSSEDLMLLHFETEIIT
ncbi:DUF4926 domain-containing protein [Tunicatimonas pelagia]|uniref:DUF4926 domain-containing protein n=1 Tax=Tunicatimonas pelagia TaxID=931531 RepID=UPI0026653EB7|nr:DUF4926 domain-containing protein [Tunicatimonas pelagia]WKN42116.1 DUF4926 domain-containing protein [Tunicatimonas pelagia]